MTHQEIDEILSGKSDEVTKAHTEIVELQRGEATVIKTGIEFLDFFLIGGLSNKMVFCGSRPGMGKTTSSEEIITNLLDPKINPTQDISVLKWNLEMPTKSLLLRDYKKVLGRKMRDILTKPFTEEEIPDIKKVVAKHKDKRVTNFSRILSGEELRYMLDKFCKLSDERGYYEKVVIIDHLHIFSTKKEIDEVLSICNEFKMKDSKLSFIIYFQFNRTLEDVWRDSKDKKALPKNFLPNSSHIYNTDTLMQYGSIVMGLVIPQVVDLDEFVSVYKDRNEHLKEHFVDDIADNSTVRLKGRNRIYYNFIKIRDIDDMDDPRLYCRVLNPEYEKTAEKIYQENKNPAFGITVNSPIFEMPKFDFENKPLPTPSLNEAFGNKNSDFDPPF